MIDYQELGNRLAIAVKESPGFGIDDPEIRDSYRKTNAQRIWEIWMQCSMFDPRDRERMFSTYSGLPVGVVNRYMEVCRQYQEDRTAARIKASRVKSKVTSKK